jgi:hyperosmotically inducible protein
MKHNLIATSLGAILFAGTMGAALASDPPTTSSTTTVTTQQSSSEQPGTDGWITAKVKSELAMTKGVTSTDISVTTFNGVVALSGMLDTKAQVDKAVACAEGVKGVQHVDWSALTARDDVGSN